MTPAPVSLDTTDYRCLESPVAIERSKSELLASERPREDNAAMTKTARLLLVLAIAGCSDDKEQGSSGSSSGAPDAAPEAGFPADCPGGDEGGAVPTTSAELNLWLQRRAYKCWARESAIHPSTGVHGFNIRVHVNATLDASMKAHNPEHPLGAVAVKELYAADKETLTGWAVSVKNQPTSDSGQGWYWYETYSIAPEAPPSTEGQGNTLCSNCHITGEDLFLTLFPLR
jgi:hypothetical protein